MVSITLIAALLPLTALPMVNAKRPSDSSISYQNLHPNSQLDSNNAYPKTSSTVVTRDKNGWNPSKGTNYNECGDTDWIGTITKGELSNSAVEALSQTSRAHDGGGFFVFDDLMAQTDSDHLFASGAIDNEGNVCLMCFRLAHLVGVSYASYGVRVGNLDVADLARDSLAKQVFGGRLNCSSAKLDDAGRPVNQLLSWWLTNTMDNCTQTHLIDQPDL